jgi:L-alanine-DL-glutamate epimerase-like enolase superfamily enzyme
MMLTTKIISIEKSHLRGTRPRNIGYNARIGNHGSGIGDAVIRVQTEGGAAGLGWARINEEEAQNLVGRSVEELFDLEEMSTTADGEVLDLPLWDLVSKLHGQPLYQFLGARGSREVETYDGSIYIDDLEADDDEVVEIFQKEVQTGREYGFTNFKIKIGRGARWMPMQEGLARDILVIHIVREAAGQDAKILVDANMGNTLNSARHILDECSDANIFWFEEPFAEDPALNKALSEFIEEKGYATLVADGEFAPPPSFFQMVEQGWIDLVQQDFRFKGLSWWRKTAEMIEPWGALCAPHTWGSFVEKFPHAHFAASVPHYSLLEACPADMPGLITDAWKMEDGKLFVPDEPGCGFDVDEEFYQKGLQDKGCFMVKA